MRLTRTGNVFTGSYSEDGVNWTVAASRSITMPTLAAVGLAASSHNMTRLTRATFDNLSTTGATPNAAPVIVTAASATPTPVTGTSTTLSVTASDDGPASELTYGWVTVSKPHAAVADPTFSINNTNGARVTTATFAAAGNYLMRVTVRDAQGLAVTSEVAVVVTLRAGTGTYEFDAPRPQFVVTFNGNIAASLGASDLALTNLTTGETVPAAEMASSFDAATGRATFTFTGRPDGTLPDGNYRATIAAGSVAEPSLVSLAADAAFDFFVKAGDANRDRVVDFQDLVILADAYNQAGRTFSGGNFNYDPDGRVDFADLVILAQNYNTTLAATPAAASAPLPMASATSLTTTTKRRKGSAAATDIV
jgi:hypothetical protein